MKAFLITNSHKMIDCGFELRVFDFTCQDSPFLDLFFLGSLPIFKNPAILEYGFTHTRPRITHFLVESHKLENEENYIAK